MKYTTLSTGTSSTILCHDPDLKWGEFGYGEINLNNWGKIIIILKNPKLRGLAGN